MMKRLVIFIFCLYLPSALAEAKDSEYRVLKKFSQQDREVVLLVREDGHLLGQPFQVELRANCGEASQDVLSWPVQDSFSVCDLEPQSVMINRQKTGLALKAKMMDHQNYEQQLDLGIQSPQPTCEEKTTIKKFSLRGLCQ